jgi:hypothetical protein
MNRLLMMGLFIVGAFALFPRTAPAVPACMNCECKSMLYWRDFSWKETFGLRKPDPNNAKLTVPVEHALPGIPEGPLYAAAPSSGKLVSTTNVYQRYVYTSAWNTPCLVPNPPPANARAQVTLVNPTPNDYAIAPGWPPEYQWICKE